MTSKGICAIRLWDLNFFTIFWNPLLINLGHTMNRRRWFRSFFQIILKCSRFLLQIIDFLISLTPYLKVIQSIILVWIIIIWITLIRMGFLIIIHFSLIYFKLCLIFHNFFIFYYFIRTIIILYRLYLT